MKPNNNDISKEFLDFVKKSKSPLADIDRQEIERLISQGADINYEDDDFKSALHHTVINGNTDLLRIILKHQPALRSKDKKGKVAFDYLLLEPEESKATPSDEVIFEMMKIFITQFKVFPDYKQIPEEGQEKYRKFLHKLAVEASENNIDLFKEILKKQKPGSNNIVDFCDENQQTILHHLVINGNIAALREVLEYIKISNKKAGGSNRPWRIEDKNRMRACDYALKARSSKPSSDINLNREEALEIVKLFVEYGAVSRSRVGGYISPIHQSLAENDRELFKALLKDDKTIELLAESVVSQDGAIADVMKIITKEMAIQIACVLAIQNSTVKHFNYLTTPLDPDHFPPLAQGGKLASEGIAAKHFQDLIKDEKFAALGRFINSKFDTTKLTGSDVVTLEDLCKEMLPHSQGSSTSRSNNQPMQLIIKSILSDFREEIGAAFQDLASNRAQEYNEIREAQKKSKTLAGKFNAFSTSITNLLHDNDMPAPARRRVPDASNPLSESQKQKLAREVQREEVEYDAKQAQKPAPQTTPLDVKKVSGSNIAKDDNAR